MKKEPKTNKDFLYLGKHLINCSDGTTHKNGDTDTITFSDRAYRMIENDSGPLELKWVCECINDFIEGEKDGEFNIHNGIRTYTKKYNNCPGGLIFDGGVPELVLSYRWGVMEDEPEFFVSVNTYDIEEGRE